jgi:hypothetical protein
MFHSIGNQPRKCGADREILRNLTGFEGPRNLERNTGFEPAIFALPTSQAGVHEGPLPSTNPLRFPPRSSRWRFRCPSTNFHADSRTPCAHRVPGRSSRASSATPLNVPQVAARLGCSSVHVYDLCERGELRHFRDPNDSVRFDCRAARPRSCPRAAPPSRGRLPVQYPGHCFNRDEVPDVDGSRRARDGLASPPAGSVAAT